MFTEIVPYVKPTTTVKTREYNFWEAHTLRSTKRLRIQFYREFTPVSEQMELVAGLTFRGKYNRFIVSPLLGSVAPADSWAWLTWVTEPVRYFESNEIRTKTSYATLAGGDVTINPLTAQNWDDRLIRHAEDDILAKEGIPELYVPARHIVRWRLESGETWLTAQFAKRYTTNGLQGPDGTAVRTWPLIKHNVDRDDLLALAAAADTVTYRFADLEFVGENQDTSYDGQFHEVARLETGACIQMIIHKWPNLNAGTWDEQSYSLETIWKKVRGLPWA